MHGPKKKDALNLLTILEEEGHEARLVGGCVRDELLGLEPKDYDIATSASPDEMILIMRKRKIRCLLHGKEHGTITALMRTGSFEMTTLREDVKTYGRKAEVAFHKDFASDACRRDFTINAMSQDRAGKIYDYFEGRKHLKEKRIVFVGDPVVRIQEDYLRILRFFRFKSRFTLKSDAETIAAISSQLSGLENVSHERITHELELIFQTPTIHETLHEMAKTGVLAFVVPCYGSMSTHAQTKTLDRLDSLKDIAIAFRFHARLAAILIKASLQKELTVFHLDKELARTYLRLANKDKQVIEALFAAMHQLASVKESVADHLLYVDSLEKHGHGPGLFLSVIAPFLSVLFAGESPLLAKLRAIVHHEELFGFRRKSLPIDGKDLIKELKMETGPELGKALEALRSSYLDGVWTTKAEGIAWLKQGRV